MRKLLRFRLEPTFAARCPCWVVCALSLYRRFVSEGAKELWYHQQHIHLRMVFCVRLSHRALRIGGRNDKQP